MNRKYSGFTLVEMLIVMGILIILMAVGITAGRFAINRANDVAHQNAADQLYTAMQAYYTDNREFPNTAVVGTDPGFTFQTATADGGSLAEYMGEGEFTGGTEATFYYWHDSLRQSILICVTLGGAGDETNRGAYCTGNGFGAADAPGSAITVKNIDHALLAAQAASFTTSADWDNPGWSDPTAVEL